MRTRGKRVTAEAIVPRQVLIDVMRVEPESLTSHWSIATVGAFFSGANNNGAHSPNGITAMFIATGQDVANVAESSAGILFSELTPQRDLYISLTIPSLIVATHGGGTSLATQRECLEVLGCTGRGRSEVRGDRGGAWRSPASSRWPRRSRPSTGCRATRVRTQPLTRRPGLGLRVGDAPPERPACHEQPLPRRPSSGGA